MELNSNPLSISPADQQQSIAEMAAGVTLMLFATTNAVVTDQDLSSMEAALHH